MGEGCLTASGSPGTRWAYRSVAYGASGVLHWHSGAGCNPPRQVQRMWRSARTVRAGQWRQEGQVALARRSWTDWADSEAV